jgi:hypothetical protein
MPEGIPIKHSKLLYTAVLALVPHFCFAQQLAFNDPAPAADSATATPSSVRAVAATTAVAKNPEKPLTERWLDLETLSNSERYRNAFGVGGYHIFDNAQQRSLVQGKLKLDAEGRYKIGFRASSGRYFNWAYGSYTGGNFIDKVSSPAFQSSFFSPADNIATLQAVFADPTGFSLAQNGIRSSGWQFYVRELYFSATPVKPVTVEFGSFGFERGLSSEITTFDEDGYLSGERIRIHDSKHLFFDEVGFTNAFFGEIATPNLFDRGLNLKNSNYRQVFAKKQLNKRVGFSGEYTWQKGTDTGTDTLRQAVVIGTKESKVVDSVKVEAYERLNTTTFPGAAQSPIGPIDPLAVKGASGFAVTLQKKVGSFSGDIGYASVDKDYSVYTGSRFLEAVAFPLNGDAYGQGNRPFVHASYKIAPGVTAFGFYTHEVGSARVLTLNQQGLNAGMTFDFKAMVNKAKLVF